MKTYMTIVMSFIILTTGFGVNNALCQSGQIYTVLVQYFEALRTGDTQQLKSLLSDELLIRRNETFSNPRYSEFLKSIYSQVEFKVIDTTQVYTDEINVDIEVISDSHEPIRETITFINKEGEWKLYKDRKDDGN